MISSYLSEFTCSVVEDCNNGFCEGGKCVCLHGYTYEEDCSFFGCM